MPSAKQEKGVIQVFHIGSEENRADCLTKELRGSAHSNGTQKLLVAKSKLHLLEAPSQAK